MAETARSKKGMSLYKKEAIAGYLFISPWILGFFLWTLGPMLVSLFWSFTRYRLLSPLRFIGLENYIKLFTKDHYFWQSLKVTAIYSFISIPLQLAVALFFAMLINQKSKSIFFFRAIFIFAG